MLLPIDSRQCEGVPSHQPDSAAEFLSLILAAHDDDAVPTTFRLDDLEILGCGHFLDLPLVRKGPG